MPTHDLTAPAVRYLCADGDPGYRVGDDGSVWSRVVYRRGDVVKYGGWERLRPTPQYRGHLAVWLSRGRQRFVHRLVLEAFVGPCPEGMECRHLDGNPANNRLENLCWGTRRENMEDMVRHGRCFFLSERCKPLRTGRPPGTGHKLTPQQIAMARELVPADRRSDIPRKLAEEWGVSAAYVKMIAKGVRCSRVG